MDIWTLKVWRALENSNHYAVAAILSSHEWVRFPTRCSIFVVLDFNLIFLSSIIYTVKAEIISLVLSSLIDNLPCFRWCCLVFPWGFNERYLVGFLYLADQHNRSRLGSGCKFFCSGEWSWCYSILISCILSIWWIYFWSSTSPLPLLEWVQMEHRDRAQANGWSFRSEIRQLNDNLLTTAAIHFDSLRRSRRPFCSIYAELRSSVTSTN